MATAAASEAAAAAPPPSQAEERALCHASVRQLLEAGERMRLPQETISTAVLVFHRFFAARSLVEYEAGGRLAILLTTCLFLAAKVEEHPRRLRDAINAVHLVRALEREPDPSGLDREAWEAKAIPALDREYWALKEKIVDTEQLVLRVLGFEIETFEPLRLLCNHARSLRCRPLTVECAWRVLNDALFSPECCYRRPPQALAVAALHLAQQSLRAVQRGGGDRGGSGSEEVACDAVMWKVLGAEMGDVRACLGELLGLYEEGVVVDAAAVGGGGKGGEGGAVA